MHKGSHILEAAQYNQLQTVGCLSSSAEVGIKCLAWMHTDIARKERKKKCRKWPISPLSFSPTGHNWNKRLSGLKITCPNFSSRLFIINLQSILSNRSDSAEQVDEDPSESFHRVVFSASFSQIVLAWSGCGLSGVLRRGISIKKDQLS